MGCKNMKGQAAVEYLMTYGWAILALVIVVGVLITSGMLSPTYLISEECNFGNNFPCKLALYNDGGTKLAMTFYNAFPYKVKISEIRISTDGSSLTGIPENQELESGSNITFIASLPIQVEEGDVKRFVGNITYVSCASEISDECGTSEHIVTGRITGRVIPQ